MTAQEYLNQMVEECKLYNQKSIEIRDIYSKLFPDNNISQDDVYKRILSFNDEELKDYFTASEIIADSEIIFNKISAFVYFSKNMEIDLDLTVLSDVENLTKFISNNKPFSTEYIIEDEQLKEKDKNKFQNRLEIFKKSLKFTIDLQND